MESFTDLFPGFVNACISLHELLMPFALALLVASFGFFFWQTHYQPMEMFRFLTLLFLVCLLITHTRELINDAQTAVQNFVDTNIPARPENIAERYKTLLADLSQAPDVKDKGFFRMLFSSNFFEALVYAALTLISWLAMAVIYFVFLLQKIFLYLCYAVSPPLFALFLIRPFSNIAMRHALRMVALLLWNIGIAAASLVTEGLLDAQIRNGLFIDSSSAAGVPIAPGVTGWGVMQLLSLGVIALWVIASSIFAPLAVHRIISSGAGPEGWLPRAADLVVNLGLPSMLSLTRSTLEQRSAPSSKSSPSPVPAMPPNTPAPAPTALESQFVPPTDRKHDPAADQLVEAAINPPTHETNLPEKPNATTSDKSDRDFTPADKFKPARVFRQ
jgi:hypothetical protein